MSDEQVPCIATEFQFLIDTWLDEFEKDVFNGMTLKEYEMKNNYGINNSST